MCFLFSTVPPTQFPHQCGVSSDLWWAPVTWSAGQCFDPPGEAKSSWAGGPFPHDRICCRLSGRKGNFGKVKQVTFGWGWLHSSHPPASAQWALSSDSRLLFFGTVPLTLTVVSLLAIFCRSRANGLKRALPLSEAQTKHLLAKDL